MGRQSRHGRVTKLAGVTELALACDKEHPLFPLLPCCPSFYILWVFSKLLCYGKLVNKLKH